MPFGKTLSISTNNIAISCYFVLTTDKKIDQLIDTGYSRKLIVPCPQTITIKAKTECPGLINENLHNPSH